MSKFIDEKKRHFCNQKMLELFEKFDIDYQKKEDLKIQYVANGIIHPLELNENNASDKNEFGGVTDESLNFIELSKTRREDPVCPESHSPWYTGKNSNRNFDNIPYYNEEVVFLGPLKPHFGHFILECVSRLWFFLNEDNKKYKIAYISHEKDNQFFDFFSFFGLKKENFLWIDKPTKFKTVIVPEQSYVLHNSWHLEYKKVIDKIKENVKPANIEKVFFSKRHGWRAPLGDENIEKVFADNGYKIIYPENLTIKETIAILKGCKYFAACSASNAHNAVFLADNSQCIVLNRSEHIHCVQFTIDQMRNLDTTYVDIFASILPLDWSVGPFFVGYTKQLEDFLDYSNFKYKQKELKRNFEKNLIDFLKQWATIYSDERVEGLKYEDFSYCGIIRHIKNTAEHITFNRKRSLIGKIEAKFKR